MDAPSSGWEPIDPPKTAHRSKPKKQKSTTSTPAPVASSSSSGFPVTGNQANAYPTYSPQGGSWAPSMASGPPQPYPEYYQPRPPGMQPPGYGAPQMPAGNYFQPGMAPAYFADPLANVALAYGQNLAGQGKEIVSQNLERWISISTLRFYFAVDNRYVLRKLFVLCLPFFVRDWSIKFPPSQCVPPRDEPNAPDLYIPSMAFVTYVLITGVLLGTQNRFTPEHLGVQSSESLAWLIVEIILVLLTFYITNISSNLRFLHLLAFTGYKYVGMIACALASLFFSRFGYLIALAYASAAVVWFFLRSLKVYIFPEITQGDQSGHHKRRIWALLFITALQPIMIFAMTRQICSYDASSVKPVTAAL